MNLFPLLRAVRHPFGDDQNAYERYFCNGQQKRFGKNVRWDASGSSNLSLLNDHISSHLMYKTKEECLKELPPKTRECRTVPVSRRSELLYANAMNELAKVHYSFVGNAERDEHDQVLSAFLRVRQLASFAKVDATVDLAKSILQEEDSIVIFTCFVDVAKEVQRKLNELGWSGEVLTGKTPVKNRQEIVDNFQAGISPVFVGTFGVAGVGINLTAACTIILLDRPWTPGEALQAEDRIRRIGQIRPVKCIWIRAFAVDEHMDSLIEKKKNNSIIAVNGGLNGEGKSNDYMPAPKMSIHKLVQAIIVQNSDILHGLQNTYILST